MVKHLERVYALVVEVAAYRDRVNAREAMRQDDDPSAYALACTLESNAYCAMLATLSEIEGGGGA